MIYSLLYLTSSRPDILFSVCLCARFQSDPRESHLTDVKRIVRYLKGTTNIGLCYRKSLEYKLVGYCDAEYAGDRLERKNTTGSCQFMGDNLTSWTIKRQSIIALSIVEEKYLEASGCNTQILWMKTQLEDFYIYMRVTFLSFMIILLLYFYLRVVFYILGLNVFIRDFVHKGILNFKLFYTNHQWIDILIKPLDEDKFGFILKILKKDFCPERKKYEILEC